MRLARDAEPQEQLQGVLDAAEEKDWHLVGVAGGLPEGGMILFWDTKRPSFGNHLRMGPSAEEIANLADERGAGAVVGSRGLGNIKRAVMGSVSESVVRHAHCSVLVVRREGQRT